MDNNLISRNLEEAQVANLRLQGQFDRLNINFAKKIEAMKKTLIILNLCIMASCTRKTQNLHFGCNGQTDILGKWEFVRIEDTDAPEHYLTLTENGECISRFLYGNGQDSVVEKYSINEQKIKFFLIEENLGGKRIECMRKQEFLPIKPKRQYIKMRYIEE